MVVMLNINPRSRNAHRLGKNWAAQNKLTNHLNLTFVVENCAGKSYHCLWSVRLE
jgi:hypothetical protein